MKPKREDHKGHRVELREREGKPELLIDNIPMAHRRLRNGQYYLDKYAFDWTDDLMELAKRFIEHRSKVEKIRSKRRSDKEIK